MRAYHNAPGRGQRTQNPPMQRQKSPAQSFDLVDTRSPISEQRHPYTPRLIVYIKNLHPESTKTSIKLFLTRNVQKHTSKLLRKKRSEKKKEKISDTSETCQSFAIDYVDYKAKCGFDTAHVRVQTSEQAELLMHALGQRRRHMRSGDDDRGKKCKADDAIWVHGEVLSGERERRYWEGVHQTKRKQG